VSYYIPQGGVRRQALCYGAEDHMTNDELWEMNFTKGGTQAKDVEPLSGRGSGTEAGPRDLIELNLKAKEEL
jgi:hypothetical protein